MEGSFQSRLDQVFAGLGSQQSNWSVSSRQIERRQWRPAESDNEDEGEEEEEPGRSDIAPESSPKRSKGNPSGGNDEEDEMLSVQEMVGMDPTLDSEDEEDEYDKVAVGREGASDRLYTSDVHGPSQDASMLPTSFREGRRMPKDDRALHSVAAQRLAEDAQEAKVSGSADLFKRFSSGTTLHEKRKPEEEGGDGKAEKKRVRFDVEEPAPGSENAANRSSRRSDNNVSSNNRDRYKNVPDHVRHPEKYTHYTLDWSEENGKSGDNVKAMQAAMTDKGASGMEEEDLPQHVAFVPRSSSRKEKVVQSQTTRAASRAAAISIAASSAAGLEEEKSGEENSSSGSFRFSAAAPRTYRSRVRNEDDDE